jgi:hypothetical protein
MEEELEDRSENLRVMEEELEDPSENLHVMEEQLRVKHSENHVEGLRQAYDENVNAQVQVIVDATEHLTTGAYAKRSVGGMLFPLLRNTENPKCTADVSALVDSMVAQCDRWRATHADLATARGGVAAAILADRSYCPASAARVALQAGYDEGSAIPAIHKALHTLPVSTPLWLSALTAAPSPTAVPVLWSGFSKSLFGEDDLRHKKRLPELAAVADAYVLDGGDAPRVRLGAVVSSAGNFLNHCSIRHKEGQPLPPPNMARLLGARVYSAYWGTVSRAFVDGFAASPARVLIATCLLRPGEREGAPRAGVTTKAIEKSAFWRIETGALARRFVLDGAFRPRLVIFDLRGEPEKLKAVILERILGQVGEEVGRAGAPPGKLGEIEAYLEGQSVAVDASRMPLAKVYAENERRWA